MRIIIAGGKHEADFIIKMFKEEHHRLTVINPDKQFAEYISKENDVEVFIGDPTKAYVLEDVDANNADIVIALSPIDTDNYITCITAKKVFNVKKTVSIVRNPKNVDLFKRLGVDSVVSSTYVLGQTIKNESTVEKILKTLSFEDEKIVMLELSIDPDASMIGKRIKDIIFPTNINISCIFRDPHVIIPQGETMIKENDRIIIVTTPSEQENIIEFIQKRKK
jgi:trk system potassium uptake protein